MADDNLGARPPRALPQVPRWQSLRNSLKLAADPLGALGAIHARYGDTARLYIGGVQPSVLTRDPGLVQHVLQKNHRNYAKSAFTLGFARYIGHGLLTNEGPDWLRQRRLIQPGFHRQRVAGLTGLMQEIVAETLAPLAQQAAASGGAVAVPAHALMTRLTFRIIARSVFSTSFAEAELDRLAQLITEIQAFYIGTIRQPYFNFWRRLRGRFRRADARTAELRALLGRYIAQRQAASAAPRAPAPPDDLLQMLLDARYEDTGEPMAPARVLDEALILLVAGHETSANALTWLLYLLAHHPAEARLIQAETAAALGARGPAFADLPRLGRALCAVQETMRLYPPAWMVDRVALADDDYQGLRIPKGTLFSLFLYGLHRDAQHWDAPAEFRPARFAPDAPRPLVPFAYAPFGGGPRLCVGLQFALTEMQLVAVELLRTFDVEWPEGQPPVVEQPLITLRPRGDFQVRLRLRPA
ncbi:cytochrome P450 [Hymenobacter caeli]|uniref:Cytochrome P450 n=1 Tax=Hymenobacter caeli TaxID=2735894 RepID=A0ABX2FUR0_9BACT|nr:cytochrome P450 [Hymenobacter caeli]NRT20150.1 cytochrome P450 [Hymenobacter caeli]